MRYLTVTRAVQQNWTGITNLPSVVTHTAGSDGLLQPKNHGQKAVMAFAPAAQNWGNVDFDVAAQAWGLSLDPRLFWVRCSRRRRMPSSLPSTSRRSGTTHSCHHDLAYAHAYGSNDPTHGNRFMASIFPYKSFCLRTARLIPECARGLASDTESGDRRACFPQNYRVN